MLEILFFPFKLVFGLLEGIFSLIGDLIGGALSLVGGLVGFGLKLFFIGLVISALVGLVRHHRAATTEQQEEDFVSYYDENAVQ